MKAVILAAGKGSRLGSLTEDTPKSLLSLNDKYTLLDYNIQMLNGFEITDILVVTGFSSAKIERHIEQYDCTYVYNPFWNYCNVLGSLYMALPYIKSDFLFLHADTLVDRKTWKELITKDGDMVLPYKQKKCGEEEMKINIDKDGNLVEINKTMNPDNANGEFIGIAKFKERTLPHILNAAESLFKKGILNQYMEEIIQNAINKSFKITLFEIGDSDFVEVDFPEDYIMAKKLFGL